MKTLTNIESGKLNEFKNFYPNAKFKERGSIKVYKLIKKELKDEIRDFEDSPEFWWAEFTKGNDTYVIAADGEMTSSGKYVLAKVV
jgi:hypothetical protein